MRKIKFHFFSLFLFQTEDIVKIHRSKCPNFSLTAQVSIDGVNECRSNTNSLDVYSTRFSGCRVVYPIQILRPIGKYRLDYQKYLDNFLFDICSNCLIHSFIGDNPKRSQVRASKSHSGYYACEYCESKGELLNTQDQCLQNKKSELERQKNIISPQLEQAIGNNNEEEIQSLTAILKSIKDAIKSLNKKKNHIVWPSSTKNGIERTTETVTEITDKLESGEILSRDEAKGIVGRSLFLDIPYFKYTHDIPVEYMHGTCLGVVKKLVELTFNVGESRQRNTNRKLSSAAEFNLLMSFVKVVREFSRGARNLDFAVMKAQEFRNLLLFFSHWS